MSEFEKISGLNALENDSFENFRSELAPYFEELSKIGIKVLIWGPGEGTTHYPKRAEIKKHLISRNAGDEVATSEDLFREIEHPTQIDQVQLELLHAKVAHVIFGLVTSDPNQTGIYMEVQNLLAYESLVDKTWLILPDIKDWKKFGTFIQQPMLKSFPDYRMKYFRIKVLEECTEVRSFCAEMVDAQRSRLMRKRIHNMASP